TWDKFKRKHPDLLIPASLEDAFKSLSTFYMVRWSNLTGSRKEIRMGVECEHNHATWGKVVSLTETEISWEVPACAEQAARFAREHFDRFWSGEAGPELTPDQQRIAEAVSQAVARQWFGQMTTMKWWDDLWLNDAFALFCQTQYERGAAKIRE